MLHQRILKQPLDTKCPFATQHHEAKAPSRDKKDRRRSHRIHTQKWCKIIGFLLVLSTFTISMLFCKHRILNATGATSTFCENHKNRENKYRSFLWATAQFRKNIERRVGHSNILNFEILWKSWPYWCADPLRILVPQKKNVKKTLDVRQKCGVSPSALQPQHFFIFVIFSGGFVAKVITSVFDASENSGNLWTNAHHSKNEIFENDQNVKKPKLLKFIGFYSQNE